MSELHLWLESVPDDREIHSLLGPLGWTAIDDLWEIRAPNWFARAEKPSKVAVDDVPAQVTELFDGVLGHIELWSEGTIPPALGHLNEAASAITRAFRGVISDGRNAWCSWDPEIRVAISTSAPATRRLVMSWWSVDGPLVTPGRLDELFLTLSKDIPEALPDRWDVIEPPRHKAQDEGLAAAVAFLEANRENSPFLWAKHPILEFQVRLSKSLGGPFPFFRCGWLHIALDACVLGDSDWTDRLSTVFSNISQTVRPFYGEARLDPDPRVALIVGHSQPPPTTVAGYWFGVPRRPPFAMVVGAPYLSYWNSVGRPPDGGRLVIHSSEHWPDLPAEGIPRPPNDIAQDPDWSLTMIEGERTKLTSQRPTTKPETWPFADGPAGG